MLHSLETYFLVNFAIDTALIAVVARANECMTLRRTFTAGVLAASYALLCKAVPLRLEHPAIQLPLLAILSMIICGEADIRRWGSLAVQLLGGAVILGGTSSLVSAPDHFPAALISAGLILTGTVLSVRRRRMLSWEVTVLVSLKGRSVSFRALIDTGNRLREPVSGLPVLIAAAELLDPLLTHQPMSKLSCRKIPFGALGGRGTLQCFRPDHVLIRRGDRFIRAPEVWIAVYPGIIPGPADALAPPSFAVIPGGNQQFTNKIHAKRGNI